MTPAEFAQAPADRIWADNIERIVYDGVFQEGDVAIYGPPYAPCHAALCIKPGTSTEAVFASEQTTVKLAHRPDILAVVRP